MTDHQITQVKYWLDVWTTHPGTKAKSDRIKIESNRSYSDSTINCWDDMAHEIDDMITKAIDEIIFEDLNEPQRNAVLVRYGMRNQIYTFHRITYEEALEQSWPLIWKFGTKKNLV